MMKPKKDKKFWVGRVFIHAAWAKDLIWVEKYGMHAETSILFSVQLMHGLKRIKDRKFIRINALRLIIGPVKIMVGFSDI